ncbi:MAG: phage capsid protein [Oscillospiraceae bacterium]|nr:phage capsid protein [Oscillospiraceae bacterium]
MLHSRETGPALGIEPAISDEMQSAIDLWSAMFLGKAPWLDDNTQSLGLPAAIAGEFARLVTMELESGIRGGRRADFLDEIYRNAVLLRLRNDVELACASGGAAFKPFPDGDRLSVEVVPAWRFLPTAFNSRGEVTGAVFVEQAAKGRTWYTRMEYHRLTQDAYIIRNAAFSSRNPGTLGSRCALDEVEEWAGLEPSLTIRYRDGGAPERMLFSYFRIPQANHIDPSSPLGVSVYSRAADLIREADAQYSRILWEYEGSELAVDASYGALKVPNDADGKRARMPRRKQRLFRQLMLSGPGTSGDLYQVFSPEIRDGALFHGLDELLKRIEFNCSLAYGTISDPQSVEKTATEIKTSRQRSYAAVREIQRSLQNALAQLVWSMDFYASLYDLAPRGRYELSFAWGDGVLQDDERDFQTRRALVDMGILRPEKLIAWYFGVSEEEAKEYMPLGTGKLK